MKLRGGWILGFEILDLDFGLDNNIPGRHHHHTVLAKRTKINILLEYKSSAPGPQATGLEMICSEKCVRLRFQGPDVQSVRHTGARLVGLGY